MLSFVRDITARKRGERALREAIDARSRFVSNMSHEIRNPLNGIVGAVELLMARRRLPEQERSIEVLRTAAEHLMGLVDDILDMSRIEAGIVTLEHALFSIRGLLERQMLVMQSAADAKGLSLRISVDDSIPASVLGDEKHLSQVVLNLISNAVKFTKSGTITVSARPIETDRIEIAVSDSGIGISEAALPGLFSRYYRGDLESRRQFGGSGLGLAIVKGLVDVMNGSITVESTVGKGTIFRVGLPISCVPTQETDAGTEREGCTGGLNILAVDDSPINLHVIRGLLSVLGHRCTAVSGGAEAIALVERDPALYDVILMDLQMPGLDGFQTTTELRKITGRPIVAVTADAFQEDRLRCVEFGMTDFLAKPFNANRLGSLLERLRRSEDISMANEGLGTPP
jgi:nitrogen-specific signal transduction histidine kinase/CheY-like chemotaxis protein